MKTYQQEVPKDNITADSFSLEILSLFLFKFLICQSCKSHGRDKLLHEMQFHIFDGDESSDDYAMV